MIRMPHEEGWIGLPLSTTRQFDSFAESLGGVARGQAFPIEKIRLQQEYVLAVLLCPNLAKDRGPNALGQTFDAHFGFVDSAVPDAFAASHGDAHFCGLYAGLPRIAFYIADEIFLLRDVIAGYGGFAAGEKTETDLELFPSPDQMIESEALAASALSKARPAASPPGIISLIFCAPRRRGSPVEEDSTQIGVDRSGS